MKKSSAAPTHLIDYCWGSAATRDCAAIPSSCYCYENPYLCPDYSIRQCHWACQAPNHCLTSQDASHRLCKTDKEYKLKVMCVQRERIWKLFIATICKPFEVWDSRRVVIRQLSISCQQHCSSMQIITLREVFCSEMVNVSWKGARTQLKQDFCNFKLILCRRLFCMIDSVRANKTKQRLRVIICERSLHSIFWVFPGKVNAFLVSQILMKNTESCQGESIGRHRRHIIYICSLSSVVVAKDNERERELSDWVRNLTRDRL